jgi:response regulator RpfG family c-di-GMP phosphodiesterase
MNNYNEDKAMAYLTEMLALECGCSSTAARQIRNAAVLHDIGKQKICPSIINKPGKLTAEEYEILKMHTKLGAEMLSVMQGEQGKIAVELALHHHERHDGKGYWCKHTGELPIYVPMTVLADVYVALVSERPYKTAWTKKKQWNTLVTMPERSLIPNWRKFFFRWWVVTAVYRLFFMKRRNKTYDNLISTQTGRTSYEKYGGL